MVFYKSVLFLFMIFFACMETNPEAQNNPAKMQATFSADRSEDQVEIQDAEKIDQPDGPKMLFDHKRHDYGEIWHADKVIHEFEFTNTGGKDLIVKHVKVSCGCTTPEYPEEAIKPGATGKIKITFNSVGKWGRQKATARVITNEPAPSEHTLVLSGLVKVKPKKEE